MARRGWLLLVAATSWSCSHEDELDCNRVEYQTCDIRLRPCQNLVFDQMRCLRGDEDVDERPRSVVIPAEDLRAELLAAYENVEVDPDVQSMHAALAVLGLVDPRDTSTEAQIEFEVDSLLGFYSHETKEVVIVDHGEALDDELSTTTLGHEYVHALQDAEFGLSQFQRGASFSFDANLAVTSTIEGEAMLYDGFQLTRIRGESPSELNWPERYAAYTDFADDLAVDERSPLLTANAIFPYTYGAFLAAFRHGASGAPGLAAGRRSDHSTQAFLARRHDAARHVPDGFPEDLAVEALPNRRALGSDGLGAWLLHSVLVRVLGDPPIPDGALAWRGDALSIFDPDADDSTELVWKVRWSSAGQAADFASRMATVTPPHEGSLAAFATGDVSTVVGSSAAAMELGALVEAVETAAERRNVAQSIQGRRSPPSTQGRFGRVLSPSPGCLR